MSNDIPFYFPGATYHTNKKELDKLFESYGIEWDADAKAWSGGGCDIVGTFNGFKRPALLKVSGTDAFISDMELFADSVGAEIKDEMVIDIKKVRAEENEKRRIANEISKKEREDAEIRDAKKAKETAEAFESVLRVKIDGMRRAEMSDIAIRNWIFLEFSVDISERLGLEPKKIESPKPVDEEGQQGLCDEEKEEDDVPKVKPIEPIAEKSKPSSANVKPKEKPRDGFVSFVCRVGNHAACGGNTCTCSCHDK